MKNSTDFLNASQAAKYLGLKKSTIYSLTHRRAIPHYKRGKFLLFDPAELENFVRDSRVPLRSDLQDDLKRLISGRGV